MFMKSTKKNLSENNIAYYRRSSTKIYPLTRGTSRFQSISIIGNSG